MIFILDLQILLDVYCNIEMRINQEDVLVIFVLKDKKINKKTKNIKIKRVFLNF